MRDTMRIAFAVVAGLVGLILTGCATKDRLTYDNFQQLRVHSATQADVVELIGEPDNRLGDMWMYHRPDAHLEVMIDFDEQGRVTRKQWVDGAGEHWHDSQDRARPARDDR
jgi:hypothetical protein